jgi:Membrane bound O-acyl transferase family
MTDRHTVFEHIALEFLHTNADIINGTIPKSLLKEFMGSWGPTVAILVAATSVLSTYAIYSTKYLQTRPLMRKILLAGAEILAVATFVAPAFLPFRIVRFVSGLLAFALFMSLHSSVLSAESTKESFLGNYLNTLSLNTRQFLTIKENPRLPNQSTILRYIILLALLDGCTYLTAEFIPINVTHVLDKENLASLATGCFAYISLELNYTQSIMMCDLIGSPLPMDLRHKNPFMSISLSEFWGVRWNPIICRLLQTSFYKPFRKLGVPRVICVMTCFIGSGILHCIPVYISSYSVRQTIAMGSFFAIQGFLVLTEQVFFMAMGWSSKSAHTQSSSSSPPDKISNSFSCFRSAFLPYIGDACQMAGAFTLLHRYAEGKTSLRDMSIPLTLFAVSLLVVLNVQVESVLKQYATTTITEAVISPQEPVAEVMVIPVRIERSSESCKSTGSIESYTSVTEVGQLSQTTSRNTSFNSSEKYLLSNSDEVLRLAAETLQSEKEIIVSQPKDKDSRFLQNTFSRTLIVSLWVACGWLWTIGTITLLLPLFALPVHDIVGHFYHHSFIVGPFVRSMQYVGWI